MDEAVSDFDAASFYWRKSLPGLQKDNHFNLFFTLHVYFTNPWLIHLRYRQHKCIISVIFDYAKSVEAYV